MKTEPNESGPRNEYFGQLFNLFDAHIMAQDAIEENRIKERVLGISFDRVQELERRVEELETALNKSNSLLSECSEWLYAITNVEPIKTRINNNENLLTPKS